MAKARQSKLRYFLTVTYEFGMSTVLSMPRYRTINRVKTAYLRMLGAHVGERVVFYPGIWIMPVGAVTLGDDVDLAKDVMLAGKAPITIGDRTLVGYGTRIISSNHVIPESGRICEAGHNDEPVIIGEDAWIGANCVILPGVEIGDHAMVAAGAVVTKNVAPGEVVGGIPARVMTRRDLTAISQTQNA